VFAQLKTYLCGLAIKIVGALSFNFAAGLEIVGIPNESRWADTLAVNTACAWPTPDSITAVLTVASLTAVPSGAWASVSAGASSWVRALLGGDGQTAGEGVAEVTINTATVKSTRSVDAHSIVATSTTDAFINIFTLDVRVAPEALRTGAGDSIDSVLTDGAVPTDIVRAGPLGLWSALLVRVARGAGVADTLVHCTILTVCVDPTCWHTHWGERRLHAK